MQQRAPVGRGQRRHGLRADSHRAIVIVRVRADRAEHVRAQDGGLLAAGRTAQDLGVLRVPGQVVGQARADAEHSGQPVAEFLLGAERGPQGVLPAADGAEQARQTGQGQVGIGRGGDRGHQRIGPELGRGGAEVV